MNFVGVLIVVAEAMTLGSYNILRGWTIPEGEDPEAPGYLVTHENSHQTWMPAESFETLYRQIPASGVGKAGDLARTFLIETEAKCRAKPPTFNGLTGKAYNDMVGLLDAKTPIATVAEWLDVDPAYVSAEWKAVKAQRKAQEGEV